MKNEKETGKESKNENKFGINLQKKTTYTLIALTILSLAILYVAAAPPGAAPNPGHLGSAIAPGSIATMQIADSAVTSTELADNAVTNTKIASDTLSLGRVSAGLLTVLGGNLGIGNANPTEKLDVNGKVKATELCIGSDCRAVWPAGGGGGLGGTGTLNKVSKFISASAVGDSQIFDDGINVGIGTISPTAKLEVNGNVKVTSLASCDTIDTNAQGVLSCGTDNAGAGGAGIPTGAVMFFNLAVCPTGWSALTTAAGRYIVGLPSGGALGGTQGTVLSNLENRPVGQHTHTINDPAHTHTERFDAINTLAGTGKEIAVTPVTGPTGSSKTGITINDAGSVAGTNAPYIQFLVCQKD